MKYDNEYQRKDKDNCDSVNIVGDKNDIDYEYDLRNAIMNHRQNCQYISVIKRILMILLVIIMAMQQLAMRVKNNCNEDGNDNYEGDSTDGDQPNIKSRKYYTDNDHVNRSNNSNNNNNNDSNSKTKISHIITRFLDNLYVFPSFHDKIAN